MRSSLFFRGKTAYAISAAIIETEAIIVPSGTSGITKISSNSTVIVVFLLTLTVCEAYLLFLFGSFRQKSSGMRLKVGKCPRLPKITKKPTYFTSTVELNSVASG